MKKSIIPWIIMAALCVCAAVAVVLKLYVFDKQPPIEEYSYSDKTTIDSLNYFAASRVSTALITYQTDHKSQRNNLPQISGQTESTDGSDDSEIAKFYREYFGTDFADYEGDQHTLIFSEKLDVSIIKNPVNEIGIFYKATCDDNGYLVEGPSVRSFAVVISQLSSKKYHCIGS